jgi:GcrA cell cycle regulator
MQQFWTEHREDDLKRLFAAGLSCSQIGGQLGTTRNSVIGKAKRLGLVNANSRGSVMSRAKHMPKPAEPRAPRAQLQRRIKPVLPPPDEMEPTIPIDVCPNRASLLEATASHCRWPAADDGSATMVCGDPKFGPYSWCARHCRVAFIPREPRRAPAVSPTLVPEVA